MNMVNFFAMYFLCKKLIPHIKYADVLKYTVLIILINAAIATGLYFTVSYFKLGVLLNIILGFLVYLIVLLILNKRFKLNTELSQIFKHVKQKFY